MRLPTSLLFAPHSPRLNRPRLGGNYEICGGARPTTGPAAACRKRKRDYTPSAPPILGTRLAASHPFLFFDIEFQPSSSHLQSSTPRHSLSSILIQSFSSTLLGTHLVRVRVQHLLCTPLVAQSINPVNKPPSFILDLGDLFALVQLHFLHSSVVKPPTIRNHAIHSFVLRGRRAVLRHSFCLAHHLNTGYFKSRSSGQIMNLILCRLLLLHK